MGKRLDQEWHELTQHPPYAHVLTPEVCLCWCCHHRLLHCQIPNPSIQDCAHDRHFLHHHIQRRQLQTWKGQSHVNHRTQRQVSCHPYMRKTDPPRSMLSSSTTNKPIEYALSVPRSPCSRLCQSSWTHSNPAFETVRTAIRTNPGPVKHYTRTVYGSSWQSTPDDRLWQVRFPLLWSSCCDCQSTV